MVTRFSILPTMSCSIPARMKGGYFSISLSKFIILLEQTQPYKIPKCPTEERKGMREEKVIQNKIPAKV